MRRHNHGPDAGQAGLPMTQRKRGMRGRLVLQEEEDAGRWERRGRRERDGRRACPAHGWRRAVERWCGRIVKSLREWWDGLMRAHRPASKGPKRGRRATRGRRGQVLHRTVHLSGPASVGRWRINQGKPPAQRIKEPATVAPVALIRNSCSWLLRLARRLPGWLPSGAVSSPRASVQPRRQGERGGKPEGQGAGGPRGSVQAAVSVSCSCVARGVQRKGEVAREE